MEKIFFISTSKGSFQDTSGRMPRIEEVNEVLKKGAKVKMICPTSDYNGAYVVLEINE